MAFPNKDRDWLQRSCPKHGEFMAYLMGPANARTGCPACSDERRAREDEQYRREEAEERAAAALRRRLSISGLEGRFARASFDSFIASTPAQAEALQTCRQFAETFNADGGGGLWLIGPPGVGKSHLASATVSYVIRAHQRTASIHAVHEIMRMLREGFEKKEPKAWEYGVERESTDDLVNRLGTQPLLVLDEIGVSRDSEWQREQLFAIVDARYKLERPTVVISNLTAAELKEVVGPRLYDRLREGAKVVPMNWPSHRGSRG
jgi:DNA replication protein DnaC